MTLISKMTEALKCWQLMYPINNGDTLYSGHPKVMTAEVLDKVETDLDYFRMKYDQAIVAKNTSSQLYYQGIIDYLEGKIPTK